MTIIRVSRFWPRPRRTSAAVARREPEDFGLDSFAPEETPGEPAAVEAPTAVVRPAAARPVAAPSTLATWLALVVTGAVLAAAIIFGVSRWRGGSAPASLTVETSKPGAEVFLAGTLAGRTPLVLSLPAGHYEIEIRAEGLTRTFETDLAAGATVVRTIDVAAPAAAPAAEPKPALGVLAIQTDPANLPVAIDGIERGNSPIRVEKLQPGRHQVVVTGPRGPLRRTVNVRPDETVSLIVSTAAVTETSAGWLHVTAPIVLQLREDGRVIGTTESDRLMLPSGRHDIELVNAALNFTAGRRFEIAPGKTTATHIEVPNGLLNVNAQPWADVWVDGTSIGQTPIGNVPVRIGEHEILFRHPELGERREKIVVKLGEPARLGVDLRRK